MNFSEDCSICRKHAGTDDYLRIARGSCWNLYAGPYESQVQGYLYLEPLKHIENWGEFTADELLEVARIIPVVEKVLNRLFDLERLYVVTISEAVRHLHLHLIPRVKEQEIKGIPLIAQATQQKTNEFTISQTQYHDSIILLKKEFEIESF
ncbi:HIT family protein [Paenibacillus apis]|uniref:Hydrolase n=1 Tax=Paenibacillus apis TaxID=1792174 RepID=A0A919XZR8_9BACL|nr:HIT domain-containing protein [Paenibacillus apis]GIO41959.1 hydrolase [Paenibacillus apis]